MSDYNIYVASHYIIKCNTRCSGFIQRCALQWFCIITMHLYSYSCSKLIDFNDNCVKVDWRINGSHCVLSESSDGHLNTKPLQPLYLPSTLLTLVVFDRMKRYMDASDNSAIKRITIWILGGSTDDSRYFFGFSFF